MSRFKKIFGPCRSSDHIANHFINYVIPFGLFALMTGMFWLWDHSYYHRLYYIFVSAPVLIVLLTNRKDDLIRLFRNPLMLFYILFAVYTIVTLGWTSSETSLTSLARRPLNILFLFTSFGLLAIKTPGKVHRVFSVSTFIAVLSGCVSVVFFIYKHHDNLKGLVGSFRFAGLGILDNPLLTSHVYGFFTAFLVASHLNNQPKKPYYLTFAVITLMVVILTTGSRTPLLALAVSTIWLAVSLWNKRSIYALGLMTVIGATLFAIMPQRLLRSGLSLRPEIWEEALKQSSKTLWFGQGYDHNLQLYVEAAKETFYDPHNIELGVLLAGGLVGLTLWMIMYATAFTFAWKNRKEPMVSIASATIVFGLAAGFTEGGSFISRPNEHWFLIWIPLALLYSTWVMKDQEQRY